MDLNFRCVLWILTKTRIPVFFSFIIFTTYKSYCKEGKCVLISFLLAHNQVSFYYTYFCIQVVCNIDGRTNRPQRQNNRVWNLNHLPIRKQLMQHFFRELGVVSLSGQAQRVGWGVRGRRHGAPPPRQGRRGSLLYPDRTLFHWTDRLVVAWIIKINVHQ